jgi:ribosome biogenesis protein SSF1/2
MVKSTVGSGKLKDGRKLRKQVTRAVTNQSKVRLQEIGPRMSLSLIKIEEKLVSGEIHYHKHGMLSNTHPE